MRRVAPAFLLLLALGACTDPARRVTDVLAPSSSPSLSPTAGLSPEVVGEAIEVETPFAGGEVGSPVSVTGTAEVVGGDVTVRVLAEDGTELAATIAEASCGDGCRGTFAAELFFFIEERQPGWVEVSGASAQTPQPLVRVPVFLAP